MLVVYSLLISLYGFAIRIASIFNPKAKQWINGRKNVFKNLEKSKAEIQNAIWFHCASLGEFEQGRPLIEMIQKFNPNQRIVLSFYSPSGYEIQKNYAHVDHIFYLPLDTKSNAVKICNLLKPKVFILVKYEFWFNLLKELQHNNIPTILISGIFRSNQFFFQLYGSQFLKILANFDQLFVQRKADADLLDSRNFKNFTLSGDTRLDRVLQISNQNFEDEIIIDFIGNHLKVLVAGSTWQQDENLIKEAIAKGFLKDYKILIAPHEIDSNHIETLKNLFSESQLHSKFTKTSGQILIIDKIGMLSYIYRYASIAYVGGGFGKGIHNILEAAVYQLPIVFGPNWQKFEEAHQFIENEVAFEVNNSNKLGEILTNLETEPAKVQHIKDYLNKYNLNNQGVTDNIFQYLVVNNYIIS